MKKFITLAIAACTLAICSCSKPSAFTVKGNVEGAEAGQKVAIEKHNGLQWVAVDSVKIGKDGKFSYSSPDSVSAFEILRLGYLGQSIYFPVAQGDALTVNANAKSFATDYKLSGSPSALAMMKADSLLAASIAQQGLEASLADTQLKCRLYEEVITSDSLGCVSYYLVRKTYGSSPLFSPADTVDVRLMRAVANKLSQLYPDDPRTKQLVADCNAARQALGLSSPLQEAIMQAEMAGLIDIALPDRLGNVKRLSEVAAAAPATILSFTRYGFESSPAYNIKLNQVIQDNPGVTVYQVSYDEDQVFFFNATAELPWTAVRGDSQAGLTAYMSYFPYQPAVMPLTYVINGDGEISARVDNLDDLDAEVKKALR